MDMFWNVVTVYVLAGVFFALWYRAQIKMIVGLATTVFQYDAPEWMSDQLLAAILSTLFMINMLLIWPVMIQRLEGLR